MIRKYAFINAKVKARRSLRLGEEFYQALRRSRSLQESMQLFQGTSYQMLTRIYNDTGDLSLVEKELLEMETRLYLDLKPFLPRDVLLFSQSLFLRYEIDSLKFALRLWFAQCVSGKGISPLIGYFLPVSIAWAPDYTALINAPSEDTVLEILDKTPYRERVAPFLMKSRGENSLFHTEWALDSFYYFQLVENLTVLKGKDRLRAEEVVTSLVDRQNLLTMLLFRSSGFLPDKEFDRYFLPGGKRLVEEFFLRSPELNDGEIRDALHKVFPGISFGALNSSLPLLFEKMESDLETLSRRLAAGDPFTIGIILAWYLSGQKEIRTVIRILNAKFYEGGG